MSPAEPAFDLASAGAARWPSPRNCCRRRARRSILEVVERLGSVQMDPDPDGSRGRSTSSSGLGSGGGSGSTSSNGSCGGIGRCSSTGRSSCRRRSSPVHRRDDAALPGPQRRPARVRPAVPPREPGVPAIRLAAAARRRAPAHAGVRGSLRRRLADRWVERRREEHVDDARGAVGQGRGDDRGQGRTGAGLGSGDEAPAVSTRPGLARGRGGPPVSSTCSCAPSASPRSTGFGWTFAGESTAGVGAGAGAGSSGKGGPFA